MEIAKQKDIESVRSDLLKRQHETLLTPNNEDSEQLGTMTINFVLLRSPLLDFRDPDTIIVSREPDFFESRFDYILIFALEEFNTSPSLPHILWNFSRYEGRARIKLEQNPHFYLSFPSDESTYTPMFQCHPLQGASGVLENDDTVYVLFDGPGRVIIDTEDQLRVFCNVWSLNGFLIFRGWRSFSSSDSCLLTYFHF